jgi:hypothetical protein
MSYSTGMTQTITPASDSFPSLPRTIRDLIVEAIRIGGEVVATSERRFEFALPCRMVSGKVRRVTRGSVGYFVSDGRNIISGAFAMRNEIAYWERQTS